MEGLLLKIEESIVGTAKSETFKISKIGTIRIFCYRRKDLQSARSAFLEVCRLHWTTGSHKRFKDDVKEVAKGYEWS